MPLKVQVMVFSVRSQVPTSSTLLSRATDMGAENPASRLVKWGPRSIVVVPPARARLPASQE